MIAVGAVSSTKGLASFSNHGAEIVAPGVSVNSTLPNEGFGSSSGTSMAVPHVSGALALLKSFNQTATNDELRAVLQDSAEDLGATGYDSDYGYGLINVTKAMELLSGDLITLPATTSQSTSDETTSLTTTPTTTTTSSLSETTAIGTTTTQSTTPFFPLYGSILVMLIVVKATKRQS